jgi:Leucine-rich repeat (LRR) protein
MLSDNQLHRLPLSVALLTRLKTLSLTDNPIKTLPLEFSHLHGVNKVGPRLARSQLRFFILKCDRVSSV